MTTHYSDFGLLIRAIEFAARKHSKQRRKDHDASPYINHPIALMSVLCVEAGINDARILAAAALHDTIEDTETTLPELEAEFGGQIARIVAEMTDDKDLPKAERKRLQIEQASHKTAEAAFVKLADKICNLRDIASKPPANWDLARRQEYFEWAKAVVDGLPQVDAKLIEIFESTYAQKPSC